MQEAELDVDALPYERFERFGAGALTDAELLAIMIRTGSGTAEDPCARWREWAWTEQPLPSKCRGFNAD